MRSGELSAPGRGTGSSSGASWSKPRGRRDGLLGARVRGSPAEADGVPSGREPGNGMGVSGGATSSGREPSGRARGAPAWGVARWTGRARLAGRLAGARLALGRIVDPLGGGGGVRRAAGEAGGVVAGAGGATAVPTPNSAATRATVNNVVTTMLRGVRNGHGRGRGAGFHPRDEVDGIQPPSIQRRIQPAPDSGPWPHDLGDLHGTRLPWAGSAVSWFSRLFRGHDGGRGCRARCAGRRAPSDRRDADPATRPGPGHRARRLSRGARPAARRGALLRGQGQPAARGPRPARRRGRLVRPGERRRARPLPARRRPPRHAVLGQPGEEGHGRPGRRCRRRPRFTTDAPADVDLLAREAPGATVGVRLAVGDDGAATPFAGKFGAGEDEAVALLGRARAAGLDAAGIGFHVGSQQRDPRAWARAIDVAARVAATPRRGRAEGAEPRWRLPHDARRRADARPRRLRRRDPRGPRPSRRPVASPPRGRAGPGAGRRRRNAERRGRARRRARRPAMGLPGRRPLPRARRDRG